MHPQGACDSEGGTRRHNAGSNAYRARQAAPRGDCRTTTDEGRCLPAAPFCPIRARRSPHAAARAGFVDAVVGGGGLVLVPALFATYPNAIPATLFGTNKGGAIWGTAWAAVQFARRVTLARATMAWGMAGALAGSFCGAYA